MSKPSPDVAAALKRVPTSVKTALRKQCSGEWERVTLEPDGSFRVHNTPPLSPMDAYAARLASMTSTIDVVAPGSEYERVPNIEPAAWRPKEPVKTVKRALRTVVDPRALAALVRGVDAEPDKPVEGGVHVERVLERSAPEPPRKSTHDAEAAKSLDYETLQLTRSANDLRDRWQHGLEPAVAYTFKDDVLAVWGVDEDMMDAALRHPDRVELRPETFDRIKRYPVLGFWRGDLVVILGCLVPTAPKVIAAYASAKLMHDTHRVGHTGGGGAKAKSGLPTNPRAAAKLLRAKGAKVEIDELTEAPAPVTYEGEDLGKITIGAKATRDVVQSDYQRVLRKMHAIDRRVGRTA